METPPWLTKEFLEVALQDEERKSVITVNEFRVKPAVPKGTNYACMIYRTDVDYDINNTHKNVSIILKAPYPGKLDNDIKKGVTNEIVYYNEVTPMIARITGELLSPKHFPSTVEYVLVLEDLTQSGYKMIDRKKQMDYDHAVVALEALAKFHAVSLKILEERPDLIKKIGKVKFFYHQNEWGRSFSEAFIRLVSEEIRNWPESECYADSLLEYEKVIWDRTCDAFLPNETELMVLNHGDFWSTNMMFKYVNGRPVNVKLVDLQLTGYYSPALDLLNVLNGSIQEGTRTDKSKDLISIYLTTLNTSLEKYGVSKRLNESSLAESMRSREIKKIFVGCAFLPMSLTDIPTELQNTGIDHFKKDDNNPLQTNVKTQLYREILSKRLIEFEKEGWVKKNK